MRKDALIWLVIMVSLALLAGLGVVGVRLWNASQADQAAVESEVSAKVGTQPSNNLYLPMTQQEQTAGEAAASQGWAAAPPCVIDVLSAEEWSAVAPEARALLSPASAEGGQAPDAAYQALRMNVASGRMNRATVITLEGFPEIHTVGDLLTQIESGPMDAATRDAEARPDPAYDAAMEAVLNGAAITRPVCARLALLTAGQPAGAMDWTAAQAGAQSAAQAQAGQLAPAEMVVGELAAANPRQVNLDSGAASPNGEWAAFTSLGMHEGGPIFIQNLKSGEWTNLIALMNAARTAEQPELNESDRWTVIDWFPDSRRLMIARSDASSAQVVDILSGEWQSYPFPGEGNGGSPALDLAPDGSRFAYLGFDADGNQTVNLVDLNSGETLTVQRRSLSDGVAYFPRFSPDGSQLAYLWQVGDPLAGLSYSIQLLTLVDGASRELVPGNVGFTVPAWSPDGAHLAYVRPDSGQPAHVVEGELPVVESANVWVVRLADGVQTQLTTLTGQARSPQWSNDARTLAFISEDGQVGMVSLESPGRMWAAAGPAESPLLTSMFFVP